ncbi:Isochorismatase domain-containing protein 1 [Mortierella alpina]|uniref:Isochorismatase domain-containing protein 1 n=1 Tax=Mortierella alpina TaxID=64518 RepID=A0A9P6IUU8_MORAP|nr:Isochorismatase domain-containing protein 1 [Mortierella alpina]
MSGHRSVGRVQQETTAFFLCDIQEKMKSEIFQYASVVATAKKMIAAHQLLDIPLIVTEQAFGSTDSELDLTQAKINASKTKFSMYVPEVVKELKGIKTVVLFGIEAHVCILHTVMDLLENNYDVFLLVDGVSSTNASEIKHALNHVRSAGGFLTTSESVLFQLVGDVKHDKFKLISDLVKKTREATESNKLVSYGDL